MRGFFATEQFNFDFQLALGNVWYGCGDVGELFSSPTLATPVSLTVASTRSSCVRCTDSER